MSKDARTPAEIEAELELTRLELSATVDELATLLHPKTQIAEAKKALATGAQRSASRLRDSVRKLTTRARSGDLMVLGVIGGIVVTTVVVSVVAKRR